MAFTLHEQAFYALMVVSAEDQRRLISALERIEADPIGNTHAINLGPSGRREHLCFVGGYRIKFTLQRQGGVFVHDISR